MGHAFMSLQDGSVFAYVCSQPYAPAREHGVHPLDPALGITWPTQDRAGKPFTPQLSPRDQAAPTLAEAEQQGLLPSYATCQQFIALLG